MKENKKYRINGFEQINAFYTWVFNNPDKVRPTHISLYLFLFNQANRANWVEWFKCPYDLAKQGACIGNNGTYYKCLDDLKKWELIQYKKGINNYKAPLINIICLYNTEQLTEQVTVPLSEQLTGQLPVHIYKLLTSNFKRITDNLTDIIPFLDDLEFTRGQKKKTKTDSLNQESQLLAGKNENNISGAGSTNIDRTEQLNEVEILYNDIIGFFPEDLWPKTQKQKSLWIYTLDKLMRIDGHSAREIKEVIKKARENEFWKSNFLSILKLRKKNREEVPYFTVFENINEGSSSGSKRNIERVNSAWDRKGDDEIPVEKDPLLKYDKNIIELVRYFCYGYLPKTKEPVFPESTIPKTEEERIPWYDSIKSIMDNTRYTILEIQNSILYGRTDPFWKKYFTDLRMLNKKINDKELFEWLIRDLENKKQGIEKSIHEIKVFENAFRK